MKHALLVPLWLFAPLALAQQSEQLYSFKGCNTVIVQANDSGQVLFNRFLTHLEDQGFVIEKSDKERFTFSTSEKSYKKNLSARLSIQGYLRKNRIYLSGIVHAKGLYGSSNDQPVIDKGMSGSPMKEAFDTLDHIAGLFTNSERFYLLR